MREPTRTPEALHDMRSQDELTAEEWAQEFRRCVAFAVICGAALLAFQFMWSA